MSIKISLLSIVKGIKTSHNAVIDRLQRRKFYEA